MVLVSAMTVVIVLLLVAACPSVDSWLQYPSRRLLGTQQVARDKGVRNTISSTKYTLPQQRSIAGSSVVLKGVLFDYFLRGGTMVTSKAERTQSQYYASPPPRRVSTDSFPIFRQAMEVYRQLHDTTVVPKNYVVPQHSSSYPKSTWGCKLGKLYESVYLHGQYIDAEHFDQLVELDVISAYFPEDCYRPMPSVQDLQQALEVYRSKYGHCHIPEDYIIDSHAKAFPKELRGSLFGKLIQDIRLKKRYCGLLQSRIWRSFGLYEEKPAKVRGKFDTVVVALRAYRAAHGHLHMPFSFVVPVGDEAFPATCWGLQLGKMLRNIRVAGTWCGQIEQVEQLAEVGAIACYYRHDALKQMPPALEVCTAFQTYYDLHGNLDIPLDYVVPTSRHIKSGYENSMYRAAMHGCALGRVLADIQRGEQYTTAPWLETWLSYNISIANLSLLQSKGGTSHRPQDLHKRFQVITEAIQVYKDLYGNVSLPKDYVVPSASCIQHNSTQLLNPFPVDCRQLPLGLYVREIQLHGRWMKEEFVDRLQALGVVSFYFEDRCRRMPSTRQVEQALVVYCQSRGNYDVPPAFVIPGDDQRYPVDMRGCALGKVVQEIRSKKQYTGCHATELWTRMGLLGVGDATPYTFELFRTAMRAFQVKYNHSIVRRSFVVPRNSSSFPIATWDLPLGKLYLKVRHGELWHYSPHYAQLLELGVVKDYYDAASHTNSCPALPSLALLKCALGLYRQRYHHYNVPSNYVLSQQDIVDDQAISVQMKSLLIGLKLGEVLHDVCYGKLHFDAQARRYWKEVNLNLSKSTVPRVLHVGDVLRNKFVVIRDALHAYRTIHGHVQVPEDFVVPNSADFPPHCWGCSLGSIVFTIRRHGTWMREEFIDELKATGVVNTYYPADVCRKMPWYTDVEMCLKAYLNEHGNVDIPASYVLKDASVYPSEMIGCDLGLIVADIRSGAQYRNRILTPRWRRMGILPPPKLAL